MPDTVKTPRVGPATKTPAMGATTRALTGFCSCFSQWFCCQEHIIGCGKAENIPGILSLGLGLDSSFPVSVPSTGPRSHCKPSPSGTNWQKTLKYLPWLSSLFYLRLPTQDPFYLAHHLLAPVSRTTLPMEVESIVLQVERDSIVWCTQKTFL